MSSGDNRFSTSDQKSPNLSSTDEDQSMASQYVYAETAKTIKLTNRTSPGGSYRDPPLRSIKPELVTDGALLSAREKSFH